MPSKLSLKCALLLAFAGVCGSSFGQAQRHLFLDPAFLQKTDNAELHINPAQPREIVIRADQPWEKLMISFFLTVREEEGKLRMWYNLTRPSASDCWHGSGRDSTASESPSFSSITQQRQR